MKKTATMFLTFVFTLILLLSSCGDMQDVSSGDVESVLASNGGTAASSMILSGDDETSFSEDAPDEYIDEQGLKFIKSYKGDYYILDGFDNIKDNKEVTEIVIPSKVFGVPVKKIDNYALYTLKKLERVVLPNELVVIGNSAFAGDNLLQNIEFPDTLVYIGEYAFIGCAFSEIKIPESVLYIGNAAFSATRDLASIVVETGNARYHSENNCIVETATKTIVAGCMNSIIPDNGSVEIIGREAFRGCSGLESIVFPDSVHTIGDSAFLGCDGLTSIELKFSVRNIGADAFSGCSNLQDVSMTRCMIYYIPEGMFSGCDSLKNMVLPISINEIRERAFSFCTALESIEFRSENIFYIGSLAFEGCKALKAIDLPEKLETIGACAFGSCNSLSEIYIPASVTTMGPKVFDGRKINIDIYVEHESLPEEWDDEWDETQDGDSEHITVHWKDAE